MIDDGSTDRTVEVAREHGVDHVVRLTNNKGLAAAFQAGLDAALKLGADVIVNTDADNQYAAADIPALVEPILAGQRRHGRRRPPRARRSSTSRRQEAAAAARQLGRAARLGHRGPRHDLGLPRLQPRGGAAAEVVTNFTYTLESLIQAGKRLVAVEHVPIGTNPQTARVAAVRLDLAPTCAATRSRSSAPTSSTSRCGCSRSSRRSSRVARAGRLDPVPARLDPQRRPQRPPPVADPRRGAGAGRGADVRARDHRRRARRPAVIAQRVFERVRRLELEAGVEPSHHEPAPPGPSALGEPDRGDDRDDHPLVSSGPEPLPDVGARRP